MYCLLILVLVGVVTSARKRNANKDHSRINLHKIGFGTAGLKPNTAEVVKLALDRGVRLIDTAQAQEWYDEAGVGVGVSQFQNEHGLVDDDIMIVTKIHPRSYSFTAMDQKLAESKKLLNRTSLDVVLLHTPHCWQGHCTPEELKITWQTGWRNLERLSEKHNIKAIGVSNFHVELLEELLEMSNSKVSVVQNWMDPYHQDRDTRAFCLEHHIQYMAYSSFGTQWQGSRRVRHNPVLSTNRDKNPVLVDLSLSRGVSIARVVLAWALGLEGLTIIPRSARESHIEDNFGFLRGEEGSVFPFVLSEEELRAIEGLDGSIGDPWD